MRDTARSIAILLLVLGTLVSAQQPDNSNPFLNDPAAQRVTTELSRRVESLKGFHKADDLDEFRTICEAIISILTTASKSTETDVGNLRASTRASVNGLLKDKVAPRIGTFWGAMLDELEDDLQDPQGGLALDLTKIDNVQTGYWALADIFAKAADLPLDDSPAAGSTLFKLPAEVSDSLRERIGNGLIDLKEEDPNSFRDVTIAIVKALQSALDRTAAGRSADHLKGELQANVGKAIDDTLQDNDPLKREWRRRFNGLMSDLTQGVRGFNGASYESWEDAIKLGVVALDEIAAPSDEERAAAGATRNDSTAMADEAEGVVAYLRKHIFEVDPFYEGAIGDLIRELTKVLREAETKPPANVTDYKGRARKAVEAVINGPNVEGKKTREAYRAAYDHFVVRVANIARFGNGESIPGWEAALVALLDGLSTSIGQYNAFVARAKANLGAGLPAAAGSSRATGSGYSRRSTGLWNWHLRNKVERQRARLGR